MNNPPTKSPTSLTLRQQLESPAFATQVAKALPKHLTPERFIRVACTALMRTPKLAQCSQASFFNALLTLSQLGIEPDGRRAHLIPFENRRNNTTEVQLIIDYKGLVELAMRSGNVANIHADVVCENDEFDYNCGEITKHRINFRQPRGEIYAAYSICTFKDGTKKCEVLSKSEVDAVRKRSRAGNSGPWETDYSEMAKKTAFRRLSKWLPLSPELRDAVEKNDDQFDAPKIVSPIFETFKPDLPQPSLEIETVNDAPPEDELPGAQTPAQKPQTQDAFEPKESKQTKINYIKGLKGLLKLAHVEEAEFLDFMRTTRGWDDSLSSIEEVSMIRPIAIQSAYEDWNKILVEIKKQNEK